MQRWEKKEGGRINVSLALVVTCKTEELYGIHILHCELKSRQSHLTVGERQKTQRKAEEELKQACW